ncbi:aminoacyl-tRNA hydrolase [Patescibacteria group bacterium]|nr:aminoacyl-tRNA hydrolase [Patescibacteria group bacterium]
MKAIIGLGNPGEKYERTRHNVGFMILDALAFDFDTPFSFQKKFNAEIALVTINGTKTLLVKPQTFMNNSGLAVSKITSYYALDPEKDVTVIYDDTDLDFGEIKSSGKSSGGHKGMQSIIDTLSTDSVNRIRIGIHSDLKKDMPTEHFVLNDFSTQELKEMSATIIPSAVTRTREQFD